MVQQVFRWFALERKSELEIARELNERKTLNEFGRPWRMLAIRRLLTDEKYLGNYVYNRKSGKLKTPRRPNPENTWVRCNGAFEAIIDPAIFAEAGKIIAGRPRRTLRAWKSDRRMLALLKTRLHSNPYDPDSVSNPYGRWRVEIVCSQIHCYGASASTWASLRGRF